MKYHSPWLLIKVNSIQFIWHQRGKNVKKIRVKDRVYAMRGQTIRSNATCSQQVWMNVNVQYPAYLHNHFHRTTSYFNASSVMTSGWMDEWVNEHVDFWVNSKSQGPLVYICILINQIYIDKCITNWTSIAFQHSK